MKYLVIGAGGTGGSIGAFMTEAGKDVTLIARGRHLAAILAEGLKMETTRKGNYCVKPMKACTMEDYKETPDVIFVCVKGYSLADTVPFIRRVAGEHTIVIPVLNIYGTGGQLQRELPGILVTDGCIYIAAEIKVPGTILQKGDIFRVVFGVREHSEYRTELEAVAHDLEESGIRAILSDNIARDCFQKYAFVSPMAACGLYYDVTAGTIQKQGPERETFIEMVSELNAIAQAMDIRFEGDIVEIGLKIMDNLGPDASASMQRDIWNGGQSEIDGLVFTPVRLGRKYHIPVPAYEVVAVKHGYKD